MSTQQTENEISIKFLGINRSLTVYGTDDEIASCGRETDWITFRPVKNVSHWFDADTDFPLGTHKKKTKRNMFLKIFKNHVKLLIRLKILNIIFYKTILKDFLNFGFKLNILKKFFFYTQCNGCAFSKKNNKISYPTFAENLHSGRVIWFQRLWLYEYSRRAE